MSHLVSPQQHQPIWLATPALFYAGANSLCAERVDFLRQRLERADRVAVVDVNRAAQYMAWPERFPVLASFYERLLRGDLGFEVVRRAKTYPRLAGLTFADDGVDPSFLGYDHPAVTILQKRPAPALATALIAWRTALGASDDCPDTPLSGVVEGLSQGDLAGAHGGLTDLLVRRPDFLLAYRLQAEVAQLLGDTAAAATAQRRFDPQHTGGPIRHVSHRPTAHLALPWTATSMARLGLAAFAVKLLKEGAAEDYGNFGPEARGERAAAYVETAVRLAENGEDDLADAAVALSVQIQPSTGGLNYLGRRLLERRQPAAALGLLESSLQLDPEQPDLRRQAEDLRRQLREPD